MGNVDAVLEIYSWVARGELERVGELLHPDVEWSMPHLDGEARGIAEVGRFWRDYEATWDNRVIDVEEVRELAGGRVLVLFTETATGRASGVETAASPAALWTFRDGKVVRFEAWISRGEAFQALGLPG